MIWYFTGLYLGTVVFMYGALLKALERVIEKEPEYRNSRWSKTWVIFLLALVWPMTFAFGLGYNIGEKE